jgi:hypothetical protein
MNLKKISEARTKFESRVRKTETCWNWMASTRSGYGAFVLKPYTSYAHRAAWILFRGKIPQGKLVLHKCDIKICVNPDHLYIGTYKDNARDASQRGQISGNNHWRRKNPHLIPRGENVHNSKFTSSQIIKIRNSKKNNTSII